MKGTTKQTAISDIDIHEKSIASLRASFEIEGIVFTDEEIRKMVYEVRSIKK